SRLASAISRSRALVFSRMCRGSRTQTARVARRFRRRRHRNRAMDQTKGGDMKRTWAFTAIVAATIASTSVDARVTKITITSKESPTYAGAKFGNVGQYELLIGTATGELDPADRRNAIIQDIQFAPRNANGKVEYTASFRLVKPIDMSKSNAV